MAADSSLGTLGVNIAAYAGQFMAELTRAENGMTKFQRGISKTLTKAGLDTIGLGNAARAMSGELQYVWNNIEKIPGIDPAAIASVREMKTEVEEFQQAIHRLVAGGMSLFAQFGKSLGLVAGAITQAFRNTSLTDMFTNPTMMAANFAVALTEVDAALRADFDAAVKAARAQNQLAAATAVTTKVKKESANLLALISKQNEEFARGEASALQQMKAHGEAIRRDMRTPLEEWADTLTELNDLLKASAISQETLNRAMRKADIKLATDEAKNSAAGIEAIRNKVFGPVEAAIEDGDFDKTLSAAQQFESEMDDLWGELSSRGSDAFAALLASGENTFGSLVDVAARAVQRMAAELLVINPLLNAVAGMFGVKSVLPAAWSFGGPRAAGGPVKTGTSYLVGESGPELFAPATSGTIVPNHSLDKGASVTNIFEIDARGADRSGLAQLEGMIRALHGSIEHRAVAAVLDARRRRIIA